MNNLDIIVIDSIVKIVVAIGVGVVVPFAVKALVRLIGDKNFNYAKEYIIDLYKLHPEMFNEDNIVKLLDELDNKFGDRLTEDTIKRIVDIVIKDLAIK